MIISSVPMVGCRNASPGRMNHGQDYIKRSDGGVSERVARSTAVICRLYQAFRWWGVGTLRDDGRIGSRIISSVPMVGCRNGGVAGVDGVGIISSVPMVGCRNVNNNVVTRPCDYIKRSDGGVSEPTAS